MNYPPEYNKYSDTVAEEILRNDSLSDNGKLARLVEHYKNRLLSTGSLAEQVNRQEKEINEEIRYAEEKIVTAFKYYKSSYENEPAFHISMQLIRLRQQALSIALAAIINCVEVTISPAGQHVFNEARRLNWTVDQVEELHMQQIQDSRTYFNSVKRDSDSITTQIMICFLVGGIVSIIAPFWVVVYTTTGIIILYSIIYLGVLFHALITQGFKWNKALSFTENYAKEAQKNIRRSNKTIAGDVVALLLVCLLSIFIASTFITFNITSGILLTTVGIFFLIRRAIKFFFR